MNFTFDQFKASLQELFLFISKVNGQRPCCRSHYFHCAASCICLVLSLFCWVCSQEADMSRRLANIQTEKSYLACRKVHN